MKSRFMDLHWQLIEMALMKDFLEAAKTSLFFSFFLFFLIQAVINSIYDISIQKFPVWHQVTLLQEIPVVVKIITTSGHALVQNVPLKFRIALLNVIYDINSWYQFWFLCTIIPVIISVVLRLFCFSIKKWYCSILACFIWGENENISLVF